MMSNTWAEAMVSIGGAVEGRAWAISRLVAADSGPKWSEKVEKHPRERSPRTLPPRAPPPLGILCLTIAHHFIYI